MNQFKAKHVFFLIGLCSIILVANASSINPDNNQHENTIFQVVYQVSQKAIKNQESTEIIDTMALYCGVNVSLYSTWNKKAKYDALQATKENILSKSKQKVTTYAYDSFVSNLTDKNNIGVWTINWEMEDIYKDRISNSATFIYKDKDEGWIKAVENIPVQNWDIQSDTMTVLGYKCQKATTAFWGRNYDAWFTLDIPLPDGPWLFSGLPGLIFKIQDTEGIFQFTAVGLEQLMTPMTLAVDEAVSYKTVTFKKYLALKKNRRKSVQYYSYENDVLHIADIYNPIQFESLYEEN
jgi:GLPGLI family protein